MTSLFFIVSIAAAIILVGNSEPRSKILEVISTRSKRQTANSSTSNQTNILAKATVTMTYGWSQWQPQVEITCHYERNYLVARSNTGCTTEGRTRQIRKCETKIGASAGKSVANVHCGSGIDSLRNVTCDMNQVCGGWGRWSKFSQNCHNTTCRFGPMTLENNTKGRYRTRVCDSNLVTIHENCTYQAKIVQERINVPPGDSGEGGSIIPNDPDSVSPDQSDPLAASTKIIAFSVAGVVMVALLGFAATRLSRTVKLTSIAHPRDRNHSSSVEANDIQYSSIGQLSNPSTPRVVIVNQAGGQPMRRQQGRRMAPPLSNLSVIREEETDDVFEDNAESEHNSDVSYDDVSVDAENTDVTMRERSDSEVALDYMDEVITQIEDSDEVFGTNYDVMPQAEYRRSADSNLLSDYGWSPRDHLEETRPVAIAKLKDGSGEGFLSASALSLASASLLLPQTPTSKHKMLSSLSTCSFTDDCSSVTGSLTSTSSLKAVRRVPSRFVALKHFASMPDMTKAAQSIPDVEEVLADSIEWRQT